MKPSPWIEGATDAIGFVAGAFGGYGLGLVLGFDVFSPGYETSGIVGIVLVGGLGLQIARATRRRNAGPKKGQRRQGNRRDAFLPPGFAIALRRRELNFMRESLPDLSV
jgi:hypothetical protein